MMNDVDFIKWPIFLSSYVMTSPKKTFIQNLKTDHGYSVFSIPVGLLMIIDVLKSCNTI